MGAEYWLNAWLFLGPARERSFQQNSPDNLLHVDDMHQLVKEPLVDVGQLVNVINGTALVHSVGDGKQALVRRILELFIDILTERVLLRWVEQT